MHKSLWQNESVSRFFACSDPQHRQNSSVNPDNNSTRGAGRHYNIPDLHRRLFFVAVRQPIIHLNPPIRLLKLASVDSIDLQATVIAAAIASATAPELPE